MNDAPRDPDPPLALPGLDAPIAVRRSPRARHLRLCVAADRPGGAELVIPAGMSRQTAERFARSRAAWLRGKLARLPAAVPFTDGAVIPYRGGSLTIRHAPPPDGTRGSAVADTAGTLWVRGDASHVPRRVTSWLRARARERVAAVLAAKTDALMAARPMARRPAGFRIGDQRSRWGSCSGQGRLNFSWRLILAPDYVLDYLVAHEVAHLAELNHSQRFWGLCAHLAADMAGAEAWLKRHGPGLLRYGRAASAEILTGAAAGG